MECTICKKEIKDDAKKCEHCGSYTRKARRAWEWVRDIGQFVAFIAAVVVLILMYESNQGMQEQLNLQRRANEELSQQIIEQWRPRLEFPTPKIVLTDTTSVLAVDFHNEGFADAESVLIYIALKYEHAPEETLAFDTVRVSRITKARGRVQPWPVPVPPRLNFTFVIEVGYSWTIRKLRFEHPPKYFRCVYYEHKQEYSVYVLNERQMKGALGVAPQEQLIHGGRKERYVSCASFGNSYSGTIRKEGGIL